MLLRRGSTGSPVSVLQRQLNAVGGSAFPVLGVDGNFGPLTDRRVREFQSAPPNTLTADGIVGPLTHAKLLGAFTSLFSDYLPSSSKHMFAGFASGGGSAGSGGQSGSQTLGLGIVTELRKDARDWARQVETFWDSLPTVHAHTVEMAAKETVDSAATKIENAATLAGRGGVVFLSVGHGIPVIAPGGGTADGMFQLAPSGFNVVGKNGFDSQVKKGLAQVSVFYDLRPRPNSLSDKENDENNAKNGSAKAKKRLADFNRFAKMGMSLKATGIAGIVLVTCRIGKATEMMNNARRLMGVPLMAYGRRVSISNIRKGSERFFLEGDSAGKGTNIPLGEIFVPSKGAKSNDIFFFR